MGPIDNNEENCGRVTHRFPATNHREVGVEDEGCYMGDTSGIGSTGSGRNSVVSQLHWTQTGGGGSVGVPAPNLQGMCKGEGLQGGGGRRRDALWHQEAP